MIIISYTGTEQADSIRKDIMNIIIICILYFIKIIFNNSCHSSQSFVFRGICYLFFQSSKRFMVVIVCISAKNSQYSSPRLWLAEFSYYHCYGLSYQRRALLIHSIKTENRYTPHAPREVLPIDGPYGEAPTESRTF